MSVICQNFVQNAWKKDLCSNCFKSVGDHESVEVSHNGENSSFSEGHNGNCLPQTPSNGYTARNETPPHTTWKTLISEKNNKNSQPFKLENGFQGRLLTINKALNGIDKQKGELSSKPKPQTNGISVKTQNGEVKKLIGKSEALHEANKSIANGCKLSNGQNFHGNLNSNNKQKQPAKSTATSLTKQGNGKAESQNLDNAKASDNDVQPKFTKNKTEEETQDVSLHSILKKGTSTPVDNGQARRNSNVGFKDEEPLVIGYGGRDFTPEELEWEMASSDGETENGADSLDETEDDKVFSKITQKNTEFNSDNANLLQNSKNGIAVKKTETKSSRHTESQNSKLSPMEGKNETRKFENQQEAYLGFDAATTGYNSQQLEVRDQNVSNNETGVSSVRQSEQHTRIVNRTQDSDERKAKPTSPDKKCKLAGVEFISSGDSTINVAVNGDKKSPAFKTSGVTIVKTREAEASGMDVKNNSEFINGAASPPCSVDVPNKTESGKTADAVMFSDGAETTWQENSSGEGSSEWQEGDVIPGQILQAINTSLTNRHKMRENPGLSAVLENEEDSESLKDYESEANKISLSINNGGSSVCDEVPENVESEVGEQSENVLNVLPRESFLHGVVSKPSAIYGPASDFFVSRSNSSSSSSSDEQSKSQISLSINVIVNGDDSQKGTEDVDFDNEEIGNSNAPKECETTEKITYAVDGKSKPEVPAKPAKPPTSDKNKHCDKSYSPKMSKDDDSGKNENASEVSYYSSVPDRSRMTINLVDPYAESNIYQEVHDKDLLKADDTEQAIKVPGRESKLAALAIELEQVRHTNTSIKRQAPAPPKVPDPPLEDPPSCAGRISPAVDAPHAFSTFRGESIGFSSASSTTSTSSQETETGYASWNLHGDPEDHPKYSKSKSSFLLTQYSKCKMLAMGYAEDGAKARKKFSIKKLLKIGKEAEQPVAFDPNCPNPKAWKYSDHFERPRAKLEIIHPMDLENKSVTVNPGFDSLHSTSLSSFNPHDDSSFRNSVTSVSSDYGSFYSDTLSPSQDLKQEANYEYIQPRLPTTEENEESCSKTGTSSSASPTPSRSSTASQASTVTSGSSKNGAVPHRPPKPPPPPRAHSLLPGNKVVRNSDGTFKFPITNGEISSSDEVTVTVIKPQAPKRQCKSAIIRSDTNFEDTNSKDTEVLQDAVPILYNASENAKNTASQESSSTLNTSSIQIIKENEVEYKEEENQQATDTSCSELQQSDVYEEDEQTMNRSEEGLYDNLEASKECKIQTSITIKTGISNHKEKLSKSMLTRNKHPPLTKAPARPPPIYSKPQSGNFPKNVQPWKTLEDSYLALTSSNRELLIKLINQALKKRKQITSKLSKLQFHWNNFEIDASQPSSVFAFGEKIAYHATMPKYPEYSLTLVISIQQQNQIQENSDFKYPMFGKFSDCIPGELLDISGDSELESSMPATILVLDRSNILTIECFSESLPESLTEENEKELCFITLQLIQSLKSLQAQGIESIDTSCQNLLLAKTKRDKYYTLVFLYDICYEENDYSSDSCKISLCQYTLMLLFQMLKIQAIDDSVLITKFSSNMSRKVFETAFSLLSEEKAVSLSQTKTLFECYLWGVTKVLESLQNSDDCDSILHRWLDIERSNCIKCIVNEDSNDINMQNEYYSQFLIRTTVRNIREVASYL